MKKIYIAGCGGMLGQAFYQQFKNDFELRCTERIRGRDNRVYFYFMDWQYHMIRHGQWGPDHFDEMKLKAGF